MSSQNAVILMERSTFDPLAAPMREGFQRVAFDEKRHRASARELLNLAYANGGGDVVSVDEWWAGVSSDEEFSPDLLFVIEAVETGQLVAFAHCWTSAFVKDIATHPDIRGQGVGRVLVSEIASEFRKRGASLIRLKVQRDNPTKALEFYQRLDFRTV